MPLGSLGTLPDNFVESQVRGTPKWVKNIVTTKPKAEWHTTNADHSAMAHTDVALMVHAHDHNEWGLVGKNCFMSMLASGPNVAISPPQSQQWFFSLGDVEKMNVLAWPAHVIERNGRISELVPDPHGKAELLVMLDPFAWQALTYKWTSPLGVVKKGLYRPAAVENKPTIVAVVDCAPEEIVKLAARNGFWQLSWSFLGLLSQRLGAQTSSSDSMLQRMQKILQTLFPDAEEEAIYDMLATRMNNANDWNDFFAERPHDRLGG